MLVHYICTSIIFHCSYHNYQTLLKHSEFKTKFSFTINFWAKFVHAMRIDKPSAVFPHPDI